MLRCAIQSLSESIRGDPIRYAAWLFFDKKDELSLLTSEPDYFNGCTYYGQEAYLNKSYTFANYEEMLLEEAEKLFNKQVEETTIDVIDVYPSRIPLYSTPSLPYNEELHNTDISDSQE